VAEAFGPDFARGSADPVGMKGTSRQASFFDCAALPEGFAYQPEVISPDEEAHLLAAITPLPFREFQFHGFEGKRRVISFGWRYDFEEQKALPAEPIPEFLADVCRNVQAASGFSFPHLQQVLVTEYAPGAPIGWHRDRPFFDRVMGLSLVGACVFRMRKREGPRRWRRVSPAPRGAFGLPAHRAGAVGMGAQHSSSGGSALFDHVSESAPNGITPLGLEERNRSLTPEHLLTMSSGRDCDGSGSWIL